MKKFLLSAFILFIGLANGYATHNRAGEITYKYTGNAAHPYRYHITVTTYTKWLTTASTDRCELTVQFGDGDSAVAPRTNGPNLNCPSTHDGVMIAASTRYNTYETDHDYAGPGNFIISMEDQNRNGGICNIPDSENQSFFLRTELVISPFLGHNNSPVLLNPPIDQACVGVCFEHNPGAYDVDGDSLYYSLSTCYAFGAPIPGWTYPPNMSPASIDQNTGEISWCSPPMVCEYNIAILIQEYRLIHGTHTRYYIGSVLRDMQIDVLNCTNTPPVINPVNDTCVLAGSNLDFVVTATDAQFNPITLAATGGPFVVTPPATFSATSIPGAPSTATGTFHWTPNCAEVRLLPYLVTFKATDNDPSNPPPLVAFESMFIRVIAPAPTGLTATPSGASIILNWNHPMCDSTGPNPLKKYYIYRKNSCDPWTPGPCETGVPSYTGYTLIGTTNYNAIPLSFTDNNGGAGLTNGIDYSYIVVGEYNDGSQSIASQHVCARLVRDVPIITNVSVISTGTNDSIWTHWVKPIGSTANLDTIANPPPYEYRLMRAVGYGTSVGTFAGVATYTYPAFWQMTDTGYISSALQTDTNPYTYRVDFYSNGILKGSTNTASSVFLSSTPADKKVNLSWQQFVPWVNYKYIIYKETAPGSNSFYRLDSTTTGTTYVDSNLINEVNYCYRILSIGEYSDTTLPKPLRNYSEIKCEAPVDLIPPCQPFFDITTSCTNLQNVISWTNPNNYCCNDAVQINIYFAPTVFDQLQLIYSTTNMSDSTYTHQYLFDGIFPSVAGCYAVTAVDSALHPNESPIVNKICIDNCPSYELPNVFSPNGDGVNDLFTPLPDYRFVKDIDIKIFDRWGLEMFETNNPDILWDGKNMQSKKPCVDGTYFYICTVNEIRVDGIKPRVLKGFVQLILDKTKPTR